MLLKASTLMGGYYGSWSDGTYRCDDPKDLSGNIAYLANGGCTGSSVTVKHGYDASGTPITNIDGDNHLGCTNGSSQYSACTTYDAFDTHLLTAANAKNQTVTYIYDPNSANGGFGEWLLNTTDANGQTTSYQ